MEESLKLAVGTLSVVLVIVSVVFHIFIERKLTEKVSKFFKLLR